MVQCDGVDNRRAKSDAVPTLLERKRRDMEVKVVMTGTTVQGHDKAYAIGCLLFDSPQHPMLRWRYQPDNKTEYCSLSFRAESRRD